MTEKSDGYHQIIRTLSTKSVANPALIFAALCLLGGTTGAIFASGIAQVVFLVICVFGVFLPAFQIAYFTVKDPDRLQDERHVENKMMIERRTGLGDSGTFIDVDPNSNKTANTQLEDMR